MNTTQTYTPTLTPQPGNGTIPTRFEVWFYGGDKAVAAESLAWAEANGIELIITVGSLATEYVHAKYRGHRIPVVTSASKDPVLRGEWLRPGALVCAVGANEPRARELDNVVLERAAFVCCDSREQARLESGDLIEPVEAGVLDWLEVHELQEVVGGELEGRQADDDIVLFKSNGLAAWDVAIGSVALEKARERGIGAEV